MLKRKQKEGKLHVMNDRMFYREKRHGKRWRWHVLIGL